MVLFVLGFLSGSFVTASASALAVFLGQRKLTQEKMEAWAERVERKIEHARGVRGEILDSRDPGDLFEDGWEEEDDDQAEI